MRCRVVGCAGEVVETTVRCVEHLDDPDQALAYAEEYAVAGVVYYRALTGGGESFMSDQRYDGLCAMMLQRWGEFRRFPWVDRASLVAGTGFDAGKVPEDLVRWAEEWAAPRKVG